MFYGLCLNKAMAVDESQCHWSPLLPRQRVFPLQAATGFQIYNKCKRGRNQENLQKGGELTFITRVQWLSLRGLNNQYVKLSGFVLTPTTHLQTPVCFFITGRKCWGAEPRQGDEVYTLEICYTFSWDHQTCTFTAGCFFFFFNHKFTTTAQKGG